MAGFETVNLSTGDMSTYSTLHSKCLLKSVGSGREAEGEILSYLQLVEKEKPC